MRFLEVVCRVIYEKVQVVKGGLGAVAFVGAVVVKFCGGGTDCDGAIAEEVEDDCAEWWVLRFPECAIKSIPWGIIDAGVKEERGDHCVDECYTTDIQVFHNTVR